MAWNFDEQHSIRRYLLRQLSEDQQQTIEKRLLVEADLFEELETTEAQLMDDYVGGRLTEPELAEFEKHFLTTPERQQAMRFARVLKRYVALHPPQENERRAALSWWQEWENQGWGLRVAAGLVAVAVIAVALWFAVPRATSPKALATITLTFSSSTRAEGSPIQKFPLSSGALKVVLLLPDTDAPAASYRVSFVGRDGATTLEPTERDAQTIAVVIPAEQLKRGIYALKLIKLESDGTEYPLPGSYQFALE